MTTIIDRYAELTGGSPTPGRQPWPAAVARIAALVPGQLASRTVTGSDNAPDGLAALALGTYILASETGHPPAEITLEAVIASWRDPGRRGEPDMFGTWRPHEGYAISSWTQRLAALGHDPTAGIRWPRERPARDGGPGYTLTCFDDVHRAYGRAGDPSTRLPDPVDALWLNLREDCSPGDLDHPMVETSFVRMGSVLVNAVGPTLAELSRMGVNVPEDAPAGRQ